MSLPELSDLDLPDDLPWDRRPGEPSRCYAAFRQFRDLPPHQRKLDQLADRLDVSETSIRRWAHNHDWRFRAEEWDQACHRIEDQERLDAIRSMHSVHRRAGRAALMKGLQALTQLDANLLQQQPTTIARLMELGAKLERSTLIVSVEELQGLDFDDEADGEDPWAQIARDLDPTTSP